jgi:hypothetical protein
MSNGTSAVGSRGVELAVKAIAVVLVAAAAAGCAGRAVSPNPYIPPEALHSPGSTVLAAGGVLATAVGTDLAQDRRRSPRTRAAGAAAAATGAGMLVAALVEAIEVQKEREKFFTLQGAFLRQMRGSPPADLPTRPAEPLPEAPFRFDPADSPLSGTLDP